MSPCASGSLTPRFQPCLISHLSVRAIGGLFSVALSTVSPRLGVTQHPAFCSSDVPLAVIQTSQRLPVPLQREHRGSNSGLRCWNPLGHHDLTPKFATTRSVKTSSFETGAYANSATTQFLGWLGGTRTLIPLRAPVFHVVPTCIRRSALYGSRARSFRRQRNCVTRRIIRHVTSSHWHPMSNLRPVTTRWGADT